MLQLCGSRRTEMLKKLLKCEMQCYQYEIREMKSIEKKSALIVA